MKMSNADIVLNPTDRVVKCKSAYISRLLMAVLHNARSVAVLPKPGLYYFFAVHWWCMCGYQVVLAVMIVTNWSFDVDKQSGFLRCTAPTENGRTAQRQQRWTRLLTAYCIFLISFIQPIYTCFNLALVDSGSSRHEKVRGKKSWIAELCGGRWGSDAAGFHELWRSQWRRKRAWNWHLMGYILPGVSHVLIWLEKDLRGIDQCEMMKRSQLP